MIAALAYSVVIPIVLGRLKLPVAKRLCDKVLHTDALMQKADWMTGIAGIGGVLGIALGLWWADALAAGFISLSILKDGLTSMRTASAELLDGASASSTMQRSRRMRSVSRLGSKHAGQAREHGCASPGATSWRTSRASRSPTMFRHSRS